MNPAVVHFDRTVFGDDADQYRPGRWLADNATEMDKYMLHFGAGTRTCIGKNISLAEIHKLTPYLLRKYTFHLVEDHKTWSTNNLWFCTQQGIVVRATARPEAE
jgi:cytochrome P450